MSPRAAWRLDSLGFTRVYDYIAGKMDWLAFGLPSEGTDAGRLRAVNVLRADVPRCALDEPMGAVKARVDGLDWDICCVVNETGVLLGLLRGRAWDAPAEQRVQQVMSEGPSTIRPSEYLDEVTGRMQKGDVTALTVTDSEGHLIGLLRREDAEQVLSRTGTDRGDIPS